MNDLKIIENENGSIAVQCSGLYAYLELAETQKKRWIKRNVLENPFATIGVDYIILQVENSTQNNTLSRKNKEDYILTSDFAKKLSMQCRNQKGEDARNYFLKCEQLAKAKETELQATLYNELLGYRRLAEIRQIKIDLNKEVRNLKKAIPQPNDAPPQPKYFQTRLNLE
jgi:phage anti-repressor protein